MEKEFGNISLEHLKTLMQFADLLDQERKEVPALLLGKRDKWKTVTDNLIPWAPYYDEPMINQINGFLHAFGLMHEVRAAAKSDDPHQAMIDTAKRYDADEEISQERGEAVLSAYGLLIGLVNSFDSLRIFGKYLNELVVEGRAGNDRAYFDAIRIDPTVVCTDAFGNRLSRAVAENDQKFLGDLRRALQGKTKKHESQLNRVRLAIRALIESGGLEMPDDKLYELFVEKLKIYSPGEDAPKALREHIRKQKKNSTTQKR